MNYSIEKAKLKKHISNEEIVLLLKTAGCFVAGGAITSLFSGKEINDVDVYFRDFDSLNLVLRALFNIDEEDTDLEPQNFSLVYTHHTNKSILFTKDDLNIQLIYFKFFKSAQEIFDTFDFTINMGVYDCAEDKFIFDDNFLKDLAQRRLIVNPDTAYPIISLLRIDKYKQKGYNISRKDFVILALAVSRLDIKNWDDMADAIGGMYGYNYTDLFDVNKEFSISEAIAQLMTLESNIESVVKKDGMGYYQLIEEIRKTLKIPEKPESESKIFYKKVVATHIANMFESYYTKGFFYTVSQLVNGGPNGIYAYKSMRKANKHWSAPDKSVILKLKLTENAYPVKDSDFFRLIGDIEVLGEVKDTNQDTAI